MQLLKINKMENRIEKNIDYKYKMMININNLCVDIYNDIFSQRFNTEKLLRYKKRFLEADKIIKYLKKEKIIYIDLYYNEFKWLGTPPDLKLAQKLFNFFFVTNKECSKCERIMPAIMFNKKSSAIDGLQVWCRNCQAKANKKRIIKRLDKKINITKICTICKKEKLLSEFCKNKRTKDKVDYKCKECNNRKVNLYHQKYKKINSRITINKTDLKVCSKCKKTLSISKFYKSLYTKDGLRYSCKKCTSKINAKNYKNKKAKLLQDKQTLINQTLKKQTIVTRIKNFFKKIF